MLDEVTGHKASKKHVLKNGDVRRGTSKARGPKGSRSKGKRGKEERIKVDSQENSPMISFRTDMFSLDRILLWFYPNVVNDGSIRSVEKDAYHPIPTIDDYDESRNVCRNVGTSSSNCES
jgi:hypothetical protein